MAISAYVGVPGSGKTYEVVCNVIIPAVSSGRRVVTNIYGLSADKIYDYCVVHKKTSQDDLGEVILVSNSDVQDEKFFPYKLDDGLSDDSFCKPGDLICVDEVWRVWDNDKSIPAFHRSFIAEHRHFNDESTGVSCDLVVINQSVSNLPRFIKDRVETTYRMSKLVALGLRNRYRVDVFTGVKLFKTNLVSSYQCKYSSLIFPLYKSHENGQGTELVVDKRQNAFSSKKIIVISALLFILFCLSIYYLYHFFSGFTDGNQIKNSTSLEASDDRNSVYSNSPSSFSSGVSSLSTSVPISTPPRSKTWRISGRINTGSGDFYILSNSVGDIRFEPSSRFNFSGALTSAVIDGEFISRYTGE
ncbi:MULTISPECIES: zonular occludens toxin family protein [unclassified Escherichia]|uniref:zonular occludens toxin family protein n=1 Tax=unclassified Escherichia TaxID=2608889 RepID=UPI0002EB4984|nr:zonular occludens toxin domain-containing protein [Escherichia sp. MOD1-EC6144]